MNNLPIPSEPPVSPNSRLTMYDLPSEYVGEPALPDEFHLLQGVLLYLTFAPPNWNPEMVFSAMDLYLYYDVHHPLWYKRPDWFGVVGVPRLYEGRDLRLSYVCWQEQVNPFIVVEFLSPGTEDEDLGKTTNEAGKPPVKWYVYERILKVPYYIIFSRYTNEIQAFRLVKNRYRPAKLTSGRLLIPELELSLGVWQGIYRSCNRLWLRWFTAEGDLIPVDEERAVAAEERAAAERERADAERERAVAAEERAVAAEERADASRDRAELLAARLRELGIDPNELN